MKKTIALLSGVLLMLAAVPPTAAQRPAKQPKLKSDVDSVSYFLGLDAGMSLGRMMEDINPEMVAQGIIAGVNSEDDTTPEHVMDFLRDYFNVRIPQKALAESESYLERLLAENPDMRRTESGLIYRIIEQGDMRFRATEDDDTVEVKYVGTLVDGTEFDSNYEGIHFTLNRVIPGYAEGLRLIGKGGRIVLYLHPDLGYGSRGNSSIKPNSVMIFDVTVIDAPEVWEE